MRAGASESGKRFKPVWQYFPVDHPEGHEGSLPSGPSEKPCRICLRIAHLNDRREQHLSTPFTRWSRTLTPLYTQAADRWVLGRFPQASVLWSKVPGQKVRALWCSGGQVLSGYTCLQLVSILRFREKWAERMWSWEQQVQYRWEHTFKVM